VRAADWCSPGPDFTHKRRAARREMLPDALQDLGQLLVWVHHAGRQVRTQVANLTHQKKDVLKNQTK
jgi:hypothetical protein